MKLVIADDERAVRESMSKLIDWESLGIQLVGICRDGIEAYDMILNESPEIVITDIEMPGLTGLDLVQKVSQTDLDTQFVILSGYGEFHYAKQAMRFGVRHYLLKPCNEEQIIACVKEVQNDYYCKKAFHHTEENQKLIYNSLYNNIIYNIISEEINRGEIIKKDFEPYEQFMDMIGTEYELYCVRLSQHNKLSCCLKDVYAYSNINAPEISIYGTYVKGELFIFFQSYKQDYTELEKIINGFNLDEKSTVKVFTHSKFKNLSELLTAVINKVKQHEIIYCMNGQQIVPICNYQNIIVCVEELIEKITKSGINVQQENIDALEALLRDVGDTDFLKQLAVNLLIKFSIKVPACSPVVATDFLLNLNKQKEHEIVLIMLIKKISEIFMQSDNITDNFVEKIQIYVSENLSSPYLTLKWIAENCLYMNVDYVSRKFAKETGCKFSNYITQQRIERAKILLAGCNKEKLQAIAEQVGCGDNYQYFSQIFKKYTGMTPGTYAKSVKQ